MNMDVTLNIARRFITLPLEKRKLYLERMYAENLSPANLPVPAVRSMFDKIPLSFSQQRQWFLWQLNPESPAYNIKVALKLCGALNHKALELGFQALMARHETLRTTFVQDNEQLSQVIHPVLPFHLSIDCLAEGQTAEQYVEDETCRPFDLEQGPLLRARLLVLADDEHILVLTLHHIISDGWSGSIIVDELVQTYEGFCHGREVCLPDLPIQYGDYAIWQRKWLEAGEQERQLSYWMEKLRGEQSVLELFTDRARPSKMDHRGDAVVLSLDAGLVQALKKASQDHGCTLFMLLLASFQCLLSRYTGQGDIRIGTAIANRDRVETEGLIGMFVNTQVLRAEFEVMTTFTQLLQQVRQTVLEAQAHQELPFEQLVDAMQPDRDLSHSPLFQIMFNHQAHVKVTSRELEGLKVQELSIGGISAQFDLTLNTFEYETGIGASFNYASALFDRSTIERLGRHWLQVLEQIVRHPEQRIAELPLLDAQECWQIVSEWNRTETRYPSAQAVHGLIEAQAAKTPDAAALVFGEQLLSYAELNQRANRLARKLREMGVGPDVLVGIAVQRSVDMVVGLLGILKAGGAYVPLDPEYPQERVAYMLEHSGARLLLTQECLLAQLPVNAIDIWCLDRDWSQLADYSGENLEVELHLEHTAYCIYTSGSTGKPKGVAVRHRALLNFLFSMAQKPGLAAEDRVLALTSLSFDIAGLELYLPLLVGASVVLLADRENQDPQALLALIEQQAVTTVQATPSTWRMLLDAAGPETLRNCRLLSGGEALSPDLANRLLEHSAQVWNLYGPTETTIWSGLHRLDRKSPTPLLGKPIANTVLHIVEQGLSAAPIGVAGELLIGGDGLARGYLHRPDLTAERFVPNPFDRSEQGGGRLYRTGDLARYHAEGVIEYVSRIDHQVKIRGFRIELGEIEAKLLEHESVRETVVIDVDGPAGKQLAAYVVPCLVLDDEQQQHLCSALRNYLKSCLPAYMIPSHLLFLDKLPLTPNGKLDRKALSQPTGESSKRMRKLSRTRLERQLTIFWQDALNRDGFGIQEDFFELGGHSILALAVVQKIRKNINSEFSVYDFMMSPTIEQQARALRSEMDGFKSCLVKINAAAHDKPAIYCLPPGGGTVFPYYPLARRLSDRYRVYALLHRAFVSKDAHYHSWDEMVKFYLDEILCSQSKGPYRLLGWSTGGALAMEVAHRLEQKGEVVEWLGIIDPLLPEELSEHYVPADVQMLQAFDEASELDIRNQETVRFIKAFLPEINEEFLLGKISEGRSKRLSDEQLIDYLLVEASDLDEAEIDVYKGIYSTYALAAEMAIGYETFEKVSSLSKEMSYKNIEVRPIFWWSSLLFGKPEALEQHLVNDYLKNGLLNSYIFDIPHEQMVMSSLFLDALNRELQ